LKLEVEEEERTMAMKEKLVIIGGSAGGPSAAARAKRVNPDLDVLMIEQGRFISYGS
jgi:flavin-dependent dehydrogenase